MSRSQMENQIAKIVHSEKRKHLSEALKPRRNTTITTSIITTSKISEGPLTKRKERSDKRREIGEKKKSTIKKRNKISRLSFLTKKFMNLVQRSSNGVVNLKTASEILGIPRRRLYDITHPLEGIKLLEKKNQNNVQWKVRSWPDKQKRIFELKRESDQLDATERSLDELNHWAKKTLNQLHVDAHLAYVTCNDLRSIPVYKNEAIILIKAPPDSTLSVPHLDNDIGQPNIPILIQSSSGMIDVYLCPDNVAVPDNASSMIGTAGLQNHKQDENAVPSEKFTVVTVDKRDSWAIFEKEHHHAVLSTPSFVVRDALLSESAFSGVNDLPHYTEDISNI